VPVTFTNGVPGINSNASQVSFLARLVQNEAGVFAAVAPTATLEGIPAAELTVSGGAATAVWQVEQTNPSTIVNGDFLVWVQTGAALSASPATFTASLSPAPPAFPDSGSHQASSTLPLPRFAAGVAASSLFSVGGCPTPALGITESHSGNFVAGQQGAYTVTVSNATGAATTSGPVTVTDTVAAGMTLASMSGTGWTCPGTASNNCTRSDPLAGGASYPPITVTVSLAANAPAQLTNALAVSGGGSATASVTDPTNINQLRSRRSTCR
jgi:uncharacterized repeat protein (TIGR01451 family)